MYNTGTLSRHLNRVTGFDTPAEKRWKLSRQDSAAASGVWAQIPSHVVAAGLHSPLQARPEEPASKVTGWLRASVLLQLLDCRLEPLQKGSQKPLTYRSAWDSPTKAEKKVCFLRQKIM